VERGDRHHWHIGGHTFARLGPRARGRSACQPVKQARILLESIQGGAVVSAMRNLGIETAPTVERSDGKCCAGFVDYDYEHEHGNWGRISDFRAWYRRTGIDD
jgi:hypothetical protein